VTEVRPKPLDPDPRQKGRARATGLSVIAGVVALMTAARWYGHVRREHAESARTRAEFDRIRAQVVQTTGASAEQSRTPADGGVVDVLRVAHALEAHLPDLRTCAPSTSGTHGVVRVEFTLDGNRLVRGVRAHGLDERPEIASCIARRFAAIREVDGVVGNAVALRFDIELGTAPAAP
jgi:hypothetical protein